MPASYRAASFQSNEHFVHFQFVSCLPPPLRDATPPDTLPSLPRDLHQRRTLPTSEGVLASGGGRRRRRRRVTFSLNCIVPRRRCQATAIIAGKMKAAATPTPISQNFKGTGCHYWPVTVKWSCVISVQRDYRQ